MSNTISISDRLLALQQWQADRISSLLGSVGASSSSSTSVSDVFSAGDYGQSQVIEAFAQKRELYTAQLSELGKYRSAIAGLEEDASKLAAVTADTSPQDLKTAAKQFISQYNAFFKKFEGDFAKGGMLSTIDNAGISKFSIEREAGNVFNGSDGLGFGGLNNAGITVDDNTGMLVLDEKKFDAILSTNPKGILEGLQELGAHMQATTKMLAADDKFLAHSQEQYSNALTWIDANDPGKSTAQTSSALSIYNRISGYTS